MQATRTPADSVRFWAKVATSTPDTCWPYQGALCSGYGRFWWSGQTGMAHRFAYEDKIAAIPDGQHIDHLCRNRACCNPTHLEAVTLGENVLRGVGISAENARKTKCKHGHDFTPENTYTRRNGQRQCIRCQRTRVINWRKVHA